ncbi:hypothetical protein [Falsiroseomonas sp. E2-1-a20]|uniref:hypothetical protein n=1 Tax=Falsiroseomonas sp. E2-1-a20 TaxID=3239300 RepID=UPI003F3E67D8
MRLGNAGMRYRDIVDPQQSADRIAMRQMMDAARAFNTAQIWPEINNATVEQEAGLPHIVECDGLTVHDCGQAFAQQFQGRRLWCRRNCRSEFTVAPIRDDSLSRDTGRRFSFADRTEAALFRRTWG